jgi:hypothetical protein
MVIMSPNNPIQVKIVSYQVGFGDCFLLQFIYPNTQRNILIDFGSYRSSGYANKQFAKTIADDIAHRCGGKLHAVVATHRHQDHIYGFNTGTGWPGDVIADCAPDLVIQPWTEDPKALAEATRPTAGLSISSGGENPNVEFIRSLKTLNELTKQVMEAKGFAVQNRTIANELAFFEKNEIENYKAINNLETMGEKHGGSKYVFYGGDCGLRSILPGVDVQVLGPPTLEQCSKIRSETSTDADDFWMLQAVNPVEGVSLVGTTGRPRGMTELPVYVRWLAEKLDKDLANLQEEQTLEIVRLLDNAMNNTSVILLFTVGNHKLLFPGDAQIEPWQYAFEQPGIRDLLKDVTLYKVGHHGSRNATPKKLLWDNFAHRSADKDDPYRLISLLSTQDTIFTNTAGHAEVPRRTLLNELEENTTLYSTLNLEKTAGASFEIVLGI